MKMQITVVGTQHMDGEVDRTEQQAVGTIEKNEQVLCLRYAGDDANTCLTVTADKLVIDRRGETSSTMILQTGLTHLCEYQTPYGALTLGVTAHRIENNLSENGGTLKAAYRLDMGGGAVENEIEIIVKEVSC